MECEAQLCYKLKITDKTPEEEGFLDRSQVDIGWEEHGLRGMTSATRTAASHGAGLP